MSGNAASIAAYRDGIEDIFSAMKNEKREKVDYSVLILPKRNEGIVNNSAVHMNIMLLDNSNYTGKDDVISNFINDQYMIPKLRNAFGAYGAGSILYNPFSQLYSYSDPNLSRSYEIFSGLPEYLRSENLTQDDIDNYIIGAYSALSRTQGQNTGAMSAMNMRLLGCSEEMYLKWMKEAKTTTPDDIKASADTWDEMISDGVRSSSGTESSLKEAGDLFDVLIYPDGAEKALES